MTNTGQAAQSMGMFPVLLDAAKEEAPRRACYIGSPKLLMLSHAVLIVDHAFNGTCFLVGSALRRREFRDVDVRLILRDEEYDLRFPAQRGGTIPSRVDPFWSLICTSISNQLATQSRLPVDFQVQRMTQANELYKGPRMALGLFPHWSWPTVGQMPRDDDAGGDETADGGP